MWLVWKGCRRKPLLSKMKLAPELHFSKLHQKIATRRLKQSFTDVCANIVSLHKETSANTKLPSDSWIMWTGLFCSHHHEPASKWDSLWTNSLLHTAILPFLYIGNTFTSSWSGGSWRKLDGRNWNNFVQRGSLKGQLLKTGCKGQLSKLSHWVINDV